MPLRPRLFLFWGLFLAAAGVAGFAVHRLYQRTRAEIAAQAERARQKAGEEAHARIDQYTDEARRAIITDLAGFHEDGLAGTLQRWDAANEIVIETFVWDPARGFGPEPAKPTFARARLPALWREFRTWRTAHPAQLNRDPVAAGGFTVLAVRALDNPALPSAGLRYQAENLDLLTDAGRKADPWAGWAVANDGPGATWIFWYQVGPDAAVRGCIVDASRIVQVLQREKISGGELANVTLAAGTGASPGTFLPGYELRVEPGDIFRQKAAAARLDALVAALLLGLFLLGATALGLHTWREAGDARRKITFVTQVSHELRTPLTSIRMFADMLAAPGLGEEKRLKFAGTIGAESARLGGLIERLLAFNALQQGTRRAEATPLDAAALVREVAEETAGRLAEAGLKPGLVLPDAPVLALGDRSIVKQALLNLLDNACKYAAAGGTVEIGVIPAGSTVVVRVADRGAGIPATVRERLFEPFVQGGQTLTTKSPGVGLGLSLARGLLRQAGADLAWVPSDRGAIFEIRLPGVISP
jgi:signal transduction histidine kinase